MNANFQKKLSTAPNLLFLGVILPYFSHFTPYRRTKRRKKTGVFSPVFIAVLFFPNFPCYLYHFFGGFASK